MNLTYLLLDICVISLIGNLFQFGLYLRMLGTYDRMIQSQEELLSIRSSFL